MSIFSETTNRQGAQAKMRRLLTIWVFLLLSLGFLPQTAKADSTEWEKYKQQGDLAKQADEIEKAEALYEKAIEIFGKREEKDPKVAEILGKLGEIHFSKKEYPKAKVVFQRALNILVWNLGPDDPEIAPALIQLASCYLHLENGHPVAQSLYFRALSIREEALGPKHPDVADSLMLFGGSLDFPYGRLPLAIPFWKRALKIREESFGPNHLKVADSLSALAFIYDLHGNYETAGSLYKEALTIRENNLGPVAPDVLQSIYNLGMIYTRQQNTSSATEEFFRKHVASIEEALGPDHPKLASLLSHYGFWLGNVGRKDEAEEITRRAVIIRENSQVDSTQ